MWSIWVRWHLGVFASYSLTIVIAKEHSSVKYMIMKEYVVSIVHSIAINAFQSATLSWCCFPYAKMRAAGASFFEKIPKSLFPNILNSNIWWNGMWRKRKPSHSERAGFHFEKGIVMGECHAAISR